MKKWRFWGQKWQFYQKNGQKWGLDQKIDVFGSKNWKNDVFGVKNDNFIEKMVKNDDFGVKNGNFIKKMVKNGILGVKNRGFGGSKWPFWLKNTQKYPLFWPDYVVGTPPLGPPPQRKPHAPPGKCKNCNFFLGPAASFFGGFPDCQKVVRRILGGVRGGVPPDYVVSKPKMAYF